MARKASHRPHRRLGRSARRDRKTRRLLVEPLEHRTLLSATVSSPAPEITSLSVTPVIDEGGVAELSGEFCHQAQEMSGLAARWSGDGDGRDAHGDNHATTLYHVSYSEGQVNEAFQLNGVDSYLRAPYSISADTPTTISAWIKPMAATKSTILKIGDTRTLFLNSNQICFGGTNNHLGRSNGGVYAYASNAGMLGQWSHVAGTWDGTTARLYIDGVLQAENSIAAGNEIGAFPDTSIGYGIVGYGCFEGLVDEVRIYEQALSLDEVRALHQLREPGPQETYTLSVDWGDGSSDTFHYPAPTDHFRETHQYLDDGPAGTASDDYGIEISLAADADPENPAQAGIPVTVNNVAPVITALSATADTDENKALVLSGDFADPVPFASDLAGWWCGDGHADDVYGDHNAALDGGTTFAQGKAHEAFAFDGANDYARAAYTMSADTPTTVSAWINPSRHAKDAIVTIGDTRHLYLAGDGRVCFAGTSTSLAIPYVNTAVIANGALPLNTWSNVVGTWDGTTARIYVNGVLEDENSIIEGQSFNLFPDTCIGYGISGYGYFQGLIDEVRIYQRALSADEVQVLHGGSGPGTADQHVLEIDWGDGYSQTVDLPPGVRSFSLEHQYPDDPAGRPDEYTITAEVTDDDSGTDAASVRVLAVLPPTDLTLSGDRVPEHSPVGTVVGDLSVVDADPGDAHGFTLLNDGGGRFALAGSQLVVAGGAAIDFETDDSHEVWVRVTDSIGFELEKTFTIEVVDVEETPFVVNCFSDTRDANPGDGIAADASGNTTLRAAIMEANALPGDDSIVLPAGDFTISRNYWFDDENLGGDFDITDTTGSLTVRGAGPANTTIWANQLDRAFDLLRDTDVTMSDLRITGGRSWGRQSGLPTNPDWDLDGGGIRAIGATLTLERVHVTSNEATWGGGLSADNWSNVSITDCQFAHNAARWRTVLFHSEKSKVLLGIGGGIRFSGANVAILRTTVSNNSADGFGGGIYAAARQFSLAESTVTGNYAHDSGPADGISVFPEDSQGGGGIYLYADSSSISRCTFSDNHSGTYGGAVLVDYGTELAIVDTTISANTAPSGGGIASEDEIRIVNCTVTQNSSTDESYAGGVSVKPGPFWTPKLEVKNSIIAGNTAPSKPDVSGDFVSLGHNIIGKGIGATGLTDGVKGDLVDLDPDRVLDPELRDNGGPTLTHAIYPAGLALDAGDNSGVSTTAQRGNPRIVDGDRDGTATVDIGACEYTPTFSQILVTCKIDGADPYVGDGVAEDIFGNATLRAAIQELNAMPHHQETFTEIVLEAGTYLLDVAGTDEDQAASGDLDINISPFATVLIRGAGAGQTIIDATGMGDRVFQVFKQVRAGFQNLTITGGNVSQEGLSRGGGIANGGGAVTVEDSFLSENTADVGGGIANWGALVVTGSTLSKNHAQYGGGIAHYFYARATAIIANTTISRNVASEWGGGLYNEGLGVDIMCSTISHNSALVGSGVSSALHPVNVGNTIIAANGGDVSEVYGEFTSLGHNLIGNGDGSSGFSDGQNGDHVGSSASPIDPMLGPLEDNGGPTFTHALLAGSPAIDAGDNTGASTTDQRGFARIVDGDGDGIARIDIGAFEVHGNRGPTEIDLSSSSVAEQEPTGTLVGRFSTADPDSGDTFTYTLVSGSGDADNGSFTIVGDELQTAESFDFEVKPSYSIRVRSTDQGGLCTEKAFTVSVTDVNETPGDVQMQNVRADGNGVLIVDYEITGGEVEPFEIGLYRSADPAFDGGDELLAAVMISDPADLAAGVHTKMFSIGGAAGQVAMPGAGAAETDGDYHLLAVADPADSIAEEDADPVNEDNTAVFAGAYHPAAGDVFVHGTQGEDTLTVSPGSLRLEVNGQVLTYSAGDVTGLRVRGHEGDDSLDFTYGVGFGSPSAFSCLLDGGPGADTAMLTGSAGNETAAVHPASARLSGSGFEVNVSGAEEITMHAGGGTDIAFLHGDPQGNDVFQAWPDVAKLSGDGYSNCVDSFRWVHAYGTVGNKDVAFLHDDPNQNDTFQAWPTMARLYGSGYYNRVKSFRYVHAYSTPGNQDVALLHDDPNQNDTFQAWPEMARLYGSGYYNRAKSFRYVHAYSTVGNKDVAFLRGDPQQADTLDAWPHQAVLRGSGYYNRARSFRYVHAYGTPAAEDLARFHDDPGRSDVFEAWPTMARMYGSGYYNRAKSFRRVEAYATPGGSDRATLWDSALIDHLEATATWAQLSSDAPSAAFSNWVTGFGSVKASSSGQEDTEDIDPAALDWLVTEGWQPYPGG